jgi:hypothetical protein
MRNGITVDFNVKTQMADAKKPQHELRLFYTILTYVIYYYKEWYPRPDLNWHAYSARDFKSLVSTDSTTRAKLVVY